MKAVARIEDFRHGRVPRAVRERQLVELGEQLFAERGFAKASMDELARRAGVTKPVIYELFHSKEGLFRACLEGLALRLAECIADAARAEQEPEARLRAGGLAFLRFAFDNRVAYELLYEGRAHWMWDHPDVPVERLADWTVELLLPGLRRFT